MGFEVVAVNLLELLVSPGLDVVEAAGGLPGWTGWNGAVLTALLAEDPAPSLRRQQAGWRARRRPGLDRRGEQLVVRSPVDGSTVRVSPADLETRALDLGATALPEGVEPPHFWASPDEPVPAHGWVVSAVPAEAAAAGRYLDGTSWLDIAARTEAARIGPLVEGCQCRCCEIASVGYLGHLSRQHEITASHLLGWHNLHQARRLVESPPGTG